MASMFFAPILTPHGHLVLIEDSAAAATDSEVGQRLRDAFAREPGHGLLQLGAGEADTAIPAVFSYWREFSARYVTRLCAEPDLADASVNGPITSPTDAELDSLVLSVPPMNGAEYLTPAVLGSLWRELDTAFRRELSEFGGEVQDFLKRCNPAWNLVGRVHFNLAENRNDEDAPFAFLAIYTTRLSAQAKAQHLPLGQALQEYAGAAQKGRRDNWWPSTVAATPRRICGG